MCMQVGHCSMIVTVAVEVVTVLTKVVEIYTKTLHRDTLQGSKNFPCLCVVHHIVEETYGAAALCIPCVNESDLTGFRMR